MRGTVRHARLSKLRRAAHLPGNGGRSKEAPERVNATCRNARLAPWRMPTDRDPVRSGRFIRNAGASRRIPAARNMPTSWIDISISWSTKRLMSLSPPAHLVPQPHAGIRRGNNCITRPFGNAVDRLCAGRECWMAATSLAYMGIGPSNERAIPENLSRMDRLASANYVASMFEFVSR